MFYDKFSRICTKNGVSMSSVLDSVGLSRGNLSRWKSGITPKMNTIEKLSNYFQISPTYFLDSCGFWDTVELDLTEFSSKGGPENIKKYTERLQKIIDDSDESRKVGEAVNAALSILNGDITESKRSQFNSIQSLNYKLLNLLNLAGAAKAFDFLYNLTRTPEYTTPDKEHQEKEE